MPDFANLDQESRQEPQPKYRNALTDLDQPFLSRGIGLRVSGPRHLDHAGSAIDPVADPAGFGGR